MWRGSTLYFMSDRDIPFAHGQIGLYALNPDDANPQARRVGADTTVAFLDPQIWLADGLQLFADNSDGDWDIYVADGVGRHKVNLTDNSADDLFAVWRPQGR
jgi:hypothetical protein